LIHQKYGKKVIDIIDDTFTYDIDRAIKILKLIIKENFDISLIITTRVDLFNRNFARYFKKAGGKTVFFGIESGNQESLDYLNKGFTIQSIKKAVNIAKEEDLLVAGSFIIGLPNETQEMINNTISFAKKLDLDSSRFPILIPFPGTKIYKRVKNEKLLINNNLEKFDYSNPIIRNEFINFSELKNKQVKASIKCNFKKEIFIRMTLNSFKNIY